MRSGSVEVRFEEGGIAVTPAGAAAAFRPVFVRGGLAVDYASLRPLLHALTLVASPVERGGGRIAYVREGVEMAVLEGDTLRVGEAAVSMLLLRGLAVAVVLPSAEFLASAVEAAQEGDTSLLAAVRVYPIALPVRPPSLRGRRAPT